MPKKRDLNILLKKVPSPRTSTTGLLTILFAVLMFSVLIYLGSVTYTGLAISELNEPEEVMNQQNILINDEFEILEIEKTPNSVLDISLESDNYLDVFTEINDCFSWKNGEDRDRTVLYAINSIKNGDFKIGNPAEKTRQTLDLYKTNYLCLILINREFPNPAKVFIQYKEEDVGKWRII